jgi:protoporphyrin/coproporphyrin ferrochelatase
MTSPSPAPADRPIERAAVLLVNLGTPDAPTASAVRRYLAQFLSDRRVIDTPRWLWWPILHGVILRLRPRRSARAYASIWSEQGSPLLVFSQALADALDRSVRAATADRARVALAMCYGRPAIPATIDRLLESGVRRLLVLPVYPQYSATSTGAVFDAVTSALQRLRWPPELRFVNDYHDDPEYISVLAENVQKFWREHGRPQRLLLSFHGIPQRYVRLGDPYFDQCMVTAQRLREKLGIGADACSVAFQSRVGREPWLMPYTDETLKQLPGLGVRHVQVLCPGFAVDCLETLEEIAETNRHLFLAAGGERMGYIPAPNADAAHVDLLSRLVRRHTGGWTQFGQSGAGSAGA